MDTATEDYAAGIDPTVPLFQSGPTLTQLRSGTSGWSIRPDLIPGYLEHVNSAEVSQEVGRRLADEYWPLSAAANAGRIFRTVSRFPNPGPAGSMWPEGVAPAAWARHTYAVDLALRDVLVAESAERVAACAEARLCVRCGERDGQYVADATRLLLDKRPATGWGGGNAPTWCRDCAVAEVAALLDRVRAGASV